MSRQRVFGTPKKGVTLDAESVIAVFHDNSSIRARPANRSAWPTSTDRSAWATETASKRAEASKFTPLGGAKTLETVSGVWEIRKDIAVFR